MKKTVWDFFAPIYETTMKSQKNIYDYLYQNISRSAEGKTLLELATGPGMIAKHIATAAKSVVATDFAPNMIETAKKGEVPQNVTFEVADATSLPCLFARKRPARCQKPSRQRPNRFALR